MTMDRSEFAVTCVDSAVYCGVFSYLHYMLAVAQLRSGIADPGAKDLTGPFQFSQKEWDAYRTDSDFDYNYGPTDIESWEFQCHVFALMVFRAWQRLFNTLGRNPSAAELYLDHWPDSAGPSLAASLDRALAATKELPAPAAKSFFGRDVAVVVLPDSASPPDIPKSHKIDFRRAPNGATGRKFARSIVTRFRNAGFDLNQQVAALANAVAESALNPSAHVARGADGFGLFQLNRLGGLGAGHSPEDLMNPSKNITITIKAAENAKAFRRAATLEDAVSAFVRCIERPADIIGETQRRIAIARSFLA